MSWKASNLIADKHCFFGSEGGVSTGKYATLNTNLSSRDDKADMYKNFDIIAATFGMTRGNMFTIRQGVSDVAVIADKPSWFEVYADGIVTDNPDILLGIKTADCAPVLLADYKHGVIGAAHAGWRGAVRGIVENVVALMEKKGAVRENIAAAIGPCMQQRSFEVKDDMRDEFLAQSAVNGKYFIKNTDATYLFDLSGYLEDKLHNMGMTNVENSHIDTYSELQKYFSFRRNTHLHLIDAPKDYPTQYSCIRL